jgi:hypothetical protein
MTNKKKILFGILNSLAFYAWMDFGNESFFNVTDYVFYLKIVISICFGFVLVYTIIPRKRIELNKK